MENVSFVSTSQVIDSLSEPYVIDPDSTMACMNHLSQEDWAYISNTQLFDDLFSILFAEGSGDHVVVPSLPCNVADLLTGYDKGIIHGCGLIILLTEAMGTEDQTIFLRAPEMYLSPSQQKQLSLLIQAIQSLNYINELPVLQALKNN